MASFDRTSFHEATFENLDATGASGTIMSGQASLVTPDRLRRMSPEEVLEYLRKAGADVSFWEPSAAG